MRNRSITDGLCRKHGAKLKQCRVEGCENLSRGGGVCVKHGAKLKQCSVKDCENVSRGVDRVCCKHGAKKTLCRVEGCENVYVKGGICVTHGAIVHRCKICNYFIGRKKKIQSENKYIFSCAGCFYKTYPNEKIPTRYKLKQHFIHDALVESFGKDFFEYDKEITCGCSKKRPDWFRDCYELLYDYRM